MKFGFPFSGLVSAATAETFGGWGFAAVLVCVVAWLIHGHLQTQARIYEKQIDAFPKLMERRLRRGRQRRRGRRPRR